MQSCGYTPIGNETSPVSRYPYPSVRLGDKELRLQRIHYQVEIQVSVAFVHVTAAYVNHTNTKGGCAFNLPMNSKGTVISAYATTGNRVVETQVISKDDAIDLVAKSQHHRHPGSNYYGNYTPDVFHLPFQDIKENDTLVVHASYFEPLQYYAGRYFLRLPITINTESIPPGMFLSQVLSFKIVLNACLTSSHVEIPTHPTLCSERLDYRMVISNNSKLNYHNRDIVFSYSAWSPAITAALLTEPPNSAYYDPRPSFMLFVSPPQNLGDLGYFGRSVVFLIDRSGSMYGDPMNQAKRSVVIGLDRLRENDYFNIIIFDHHQTLYYEGLMQATEENIRTAKHWVELIEAQGGTEIKAPLSTALQLVGQYPQLIPFIFLITDGAVSNERDICRFIHDAKSPARICTFGIGPYCNSYFLKMLAVLGRGFSDVALNQNLIFDQVSNMFEMASLPALTNIEIGVNSEKCEIYPFPIPDLFVGAPLVISGKYDGPQIEGVVVRGLLPNGTWWTQTANPIMGHRVPINKVFVKQRLEMMTAKCWLENDDEKLKKEIVNLSVHESIPSAHTYMVSYETTMAKRRGQTRNPGVVAKNSAQTRDIVAGLAVGSVLILGASITRFGDVGATISNVSVMDVMTKINVSDMYSSMGDLLATIGDDNVISSAKDALQHDGDCCNCCDYYDGCNSCDCCDCCDCCDYCNFNDIDDSVCDCCESFSSCCDFICNGAGDFAIQLCGPGLDSLCQFICCCIRGICCGD